MVLGQRTGTHGRSVGPSGEWLALTGGLSTVRGRAPLLVRGWDGGMCWLKLGRHKTISSSAISHEDSLAWLEFGEAPSAERLHMHEYVGCLVRPVSGKPVARTRPLASSSVGWVRKLAFVDRKASASDALR